jgi:hypothetical protein
MKPRLRRGWPPELFRDVLGRSTRPRSSLALEMSTTSIRFRDVRFKLALPLGRGWPGALDHLRGSRVQRRGQAPTERLSKRGRSGLHGFGRRLPALPCRGIDGQENAAAKPESAIVATHVVWLEANGRAAAQ